MDPRFESLQQTTRRWFLGRAGLGIGGMALAGLMARDGRLPAGEPQESNAAAVQRGAAALAARVAPKAKSIIYLHMAGSPSQIDLFENKPELTRFHGQECPAEYLEGKRFAFIQGVPRMLGPLFEYRQYGQSGQWISELLPNFASVVDKTCVIRSMNTDQFNHAPAQLLLHTGQARPGNASFGSWVTYGLGSESDDLPGFVVMVSGGKTPDAGKSLWGSGFLPSVHQGVQCRNTGDPVLFLSDPPGMSRAMRRRTLDAIAELNETRQRAAFDPETETRIAQYELSYRMQATVPDATDLTQETQETLDLYGARPGFRPESDGAVDPRVLYKADDATFANHCLLARRLVERGVRFVQLYDWGWDHHGSSLGESCDETLPIKCGQIDRAVSGLLIDLERRGLLEQTLVVWGGEFGRTPMMQNNVRSELKKGYIGRDHHPYAFTMWMAGGGVKPGLAFGKTDDIGYYIAEDPVSVRDLQATILNLIGLDPYRFSYLYQGLENRLIGPTDEGKVRHELLS
ncbi:MAG TPA: DUF1501 domain-containing protein [Pirellulaceae bacterium]|nr:DUF1501 domain-containing protein [Pirellulaceae bacterium]